MELFVKLNSRSVIKSPVNEKHDWHILFTKEKIFLKNLMIKKMEKKSKY